MRIFISSVMREYAAFRTAAATAIGALDHDVVQAEDFSASTSAPRVACLAGVRNADLVVVLLGSRYGDIQPSGKSATHEEIEEAKRDKRILVFVEERVQPEPRQEELVRELRDWQDGTFTGSYTTPEQLSTELTRALVRLERADNRGAVNEAELVARALAKLPASDRHYSSSSPRLAFATVGAPRQTIIRPSTLESGPFQRELEKEARFGDPSIFSQEGCEGSFAEHSFVLRQARGATLTLAEDGTMCVVLPLPTHQHASALVEEEVRESLTRAFRFTNNVLRRIDGAERLAWIVPAAKLLSASHAGWITRAESQRGGPITMGMGWQNEDPPGCTLNPPLKSRSALRADVDAMAEDMTVLLRRNSQRR
jgi:hypothetical protein